MALMYSDQPLGPTYFRLFTKESLTKIQRRIEDERQAKLVAKETEDGVQQQQQQDKKEDDRLQPNPTLEAGRTLPSRLGEFPPELYGKPIEDLDEYYNNKYTFMVVAKDKTIFRFSASNALFILSPFNPVRRFAIYLLTHPFFSLSVMIVILVNCAFMAITQEIPKSEEAFTAIYTMEGTVKMLARGFILADFTYLRDLWNWLDFIVVTLAYITMAFPLGNLAALRTFRVLRALKTVAVVPGLKTIVGALLEAVRRLRDVVILTVFVLSIFALVGLQLYQGSLKRKCVRFPDWLENSTEDEREDYFQSTNKSSWLMQTENDAKLCGETDAGECPANYKCVIVGPNPNYGYTNFDNFGWALLCAFRLMTQDYWENLYQLVIRANGRVHMLFFIVVIFMGSFYLVNLILAIVAMSYDDCQKKDLEEAEEAEEADEEEAMEEVTRRFALLEEAVMRKSPSDLSCSSLDAFLPHRIKLARDKDCISIHSERAIDTRRRFSIVNSQGKKTSSSVPGSPCLARPNSRTHQFSWSRKEPPSSAVHPPHVLPVPALPPFIDVRPHSQPLVTPCLDNLDLPFADDESAPITPTADDLSQHQRVAQRGTLVRGGTKRHSLLARVASGPKRASYYLPRNRTHNSSEYSRFREKRGEPTHFRWNASVRVKRPRTGEGRSTKRKMSDVDGCQAADCDAGKDFLFPDNPFICRTPSTTIIDIQDVLVLKDLINHASGKKGFLAQEGVLKDYMKTKCLHLLFGWECCSCWYRFAHLVELVIMDAFVDLFITLCIVINTLFMAMENAGMSETLARTLVVGNYVFTTIFTTEAILKILALGLFTYLKDKWNCFDVIIVILSLVELGLSNVKGLSILRSFRLLRVFKLAKSWPTLNLLIGIIGRTMGALGNLCLVLAIIIFIFAVMGMQLYGTHYTEQLFPAGVPRWNFTDFLHSFMIVFRVLCGEWIESMWDCIHCTSFICVPFFLLTMIIGNLVVLNLFLALLLSSFGAESFQHSQEDAETNKLQEAIDRINRFIIFLKSHAMSCVKVKGHYKAPTTTDDATSSDAEAREKIFPSAAEQTTRAMGRVTNGPRTNFEEREFGSSNGSKYCMLHEETTTEIQNSLRHFRGSSKSHVGYVLVSPFETYEEFNYQDTEAPTRPASAKSGASLGNVAPGLLPQRPAEHLSSLASSSLSSSETSLIINPVFCEETASVNDKTLSVAEGPEVNEVKVVFVRYPDECCPLCCTKRSRCCPLVDRSLMGRVWWAFRCAMYKLVEHKYFETFIILMILASSLALAIEDVYIEERKILKSILKIMDKSFTIIFVFEMVMKWTAYGFKKYFTDAWCWLDFIIVAISLISMGAEGAGLGNMGAFRALRTLRALRPLRAVSRWEGMKVVVNALIQAIPAIFNVLLVCLVFWLIFSIMGVNLFGGRFESCLDADGKTVDHKIVFNKSECQAKSYLNYTWENPKINFDNVLGAYLALFQVATFKGWMPIMTHAIDSKELGQQPDRESRSGMYLYFVFFIVFGSFFTLNLFIGVIIDNFNMQKKKAGGSLEMFMTEDQKKYYNAMKKLGSKQPQKPIPKPRLKCQMVFFQMITNQKFDIGIMIVILLNMMTMAMEHYNEPQHFSDILHYINIVFIAIFTLECVMKLVALRWYYFKQPWNVFDFIVVVLSILGLAMADIVSKFYVSPTLLRVVRVFRIGRILRLVKSAKGIRTLLFSLAVSLPALFNIGLLLFLVMFIYAIFGMSFFMHVMHTEGIDDIFNFETFGNSMILLFQISTSAGWDGVLAGLMNDQPPDCNPTWSEEKPNGDCGNSRLAIMYLVTYLVISFLVVINMYIAVILENFSQATEDVQQGLTQDDFDMYYEVWERFDEKASQYIPLSRLGEFVDALEHPLCLPAPNFYKLVSLDIPICEGDKVHCVDILDALAKNFLSSGGEGASDLGDFRKGLGRKDYRPVSSTLKRQREIYCAKKILRAMSRFVDRRRQERSGNDPKVAARTKLDSIPEHSIITGSDSIDDVDSLPPETATNNTKTDGRAENRTVDPFAHSGANA